LIDFLEKHLHIISFDIPFPANYGGVIDVYYKLVWLKRAGVKVTLHCFEYGRKHAKELDELCETVYYYPRKTGFLNLLSLLPYTVKSRQSAQLMKNLKKDNHPILCEVLHTCGILNMADFKSRFKIYRHSNIEHEYYTALARAEKKFFKKIFLFSEAWKLKRFEKTITHANLILAVNQNDAEYFKQHYPDVETHYLPSFHESEKVDIENGSGKFILFHGNLSVAENHRAAMWLIKHVFSKINLPVIIAGLKPSPKLRLRADKYDHIDLIPNPTHDKMAELVKKAHQHVLFTHQATGLKLKLLNVLFGGRFIVCNTDMLKGSGLTKTDGINVCSNAQEMIDAILKNNDRNFDENLANERREICQTFSNQLNTKKLIDLIFPPSGMNFN
jgi:glycosyltransferase involved in cell wall biosynthesis